MEIITTNKLTDWFALRTGDWIFTTADDRVGVVREIDQYATHVESVGGLFVIPHSRAQAAQNHFSQLLV